MDTNRHKYGWPSFSFEFISCGLDHYPRMQLLAVPEILEGKRFDTPGAVGKGDPQKRMDLR